MLQRVKNLLKLSRYNVVEDIELTSNGITRSLPRLVNTDKPKKKLATIVNMQGTYQPLDDFPDETLK
jgi:hypothetical protein